MVKWPHKRHALWEDIVAVFLVGAAIVLVVAFTVDKRNPCRLDAKIGMMQACLSAPKCSLNAEELRAYQEYERRCLASTNE